MAIRTVGVLGCGLMGSGIAQVCAQSGYRTIVREVEPDLVDEGLQRIDRFLADGITHGKVAPEGKKRALENLTGTTRIEDLADCDIGIHPRFALPSLRQRPDGGIESWVCTSLARCRL